MQTLVFVLLLAISTPVEKAPLRRPIVLDGRIQSTVPDGPPNTDPCALARRIVHQRPCRERGDCRSLELWERSFGPPRLLPADPDGAVRRWKAPGRARARRWPPSEAPDPPWRLRPGTVCPAGQDPGR